MAGTTIQLPTREPADFRFTIRQSDWSGGHDRLYYEVPNGETEPRYWDSFNAEAGIEGEIQLAALFEQVQTDATDKQPLLIDFNGFVYKLEGVTSPAVYKSSDGTVWNSVSMASGPTNGIRGAVVWRNNLICATGSNNAVYQLTSGDVWSTIGGALPQSTSVDMIGLTPDDKLLVWFNAKGLHSWDGAAWARIWPGTSSPTDPDEATCDVIDGSTGATIIVTRDAKGSSIHEYFVPEGAATAATMVTWLNEKNAFFYVVRFYDEAAYIGAKKGIGGGPATAGQGILWRKERGQKPVVVQEIGDGIRGNVASRDFGIRGLVNDGINILWVGAPSRAGNFSSTVGIPCIYRYDVDDSGVESISPNSALDVSPGNVAGPVYSLAILNGEVLMATGTGIWKRSHTKKAAQGYVESSIYDLRSPDHTKSWRFSEVIIADATPTEYIKFYYRVGTLVGSWLGGTQSTASGAKKIAFPDDNSAAGVYKLNSNQIQCRLELYRGATVTLQPRLMSFAIDAAQIRPIGAV